jgi:hypothetical protein
LPYHLVQRVDAVGDLIDDFAANARDRCSSPVRPQRLSSAAASPSMSDNLSAPADQVVARL